MKKRLNQFFIWLIFACLSVNSVAQNERVEGKYKIKLVRYGCWGGTTTYKIRVEIKVDSSYVFKVREYYSENYGYKKRLTRYEMIMENTWIIVGNQIILENQNTFYDFDKFNLNEIKFRSRKDKIKKKKGYFLFRSKKHKPPLLF